MKKFYDYWLAVGHVSVEARKQLDMARCDVRDVSREKPTIALVYFPHDSDDLDIDFADNVGQRETEEIEQNAVYISLDALMREVSFVWRCTWGDCPVNEASVNQTELITFAEWRKHRALTAQKVVESSASGGSLLLSEQ